MNIQLQNKPIKFIIILFLGLVAQVQAQTYDLNAKLPIDKDIRIGKLANGLTYYIRKNALPKDRVELRLVINAGSVLEDEDQRGLAHFTEHMAFNGTKHFEKNELISYLQSVGIKFGTDLNAYTSFDETVYRLQVPTDNNDVVEKALLVLEDWAHNITFDPKEIEAERGVITEEWRIGRGSGQRLQEKYLPVIFNNSQYSERLPIGKIDVIKNFKPESILRFYKDWYRPDLMAVVVVGDIDVDKYEQKIKNHFAPIKTAAKERERIVYNVPDHKGTIYSIATDKEASQTQIMVYNNADHKDEATLGDYRGFIVEQIYHFVLGQRFAELIRSSDPPFTSAHSGFQGLTRTKDAFATSIRVKEDGVERGLQVLLEELERVKRFGFTQSELDRAKKSILLKYERSYSEREKSNSDGYASELIRNFLNHEAIPGISFEYEFTKNQLPEITLEELNKYGEEFLTDDNRVIVVTGPDKEGVNLPDQAKLEKVVANVQYADIKPYEDKTVAFKWPGKLPVPGTIVKEETNTSLGSTTIILSNGAKVILKPTNFKNNEIIGYAYSKGGHNYYADNDYYSALYAASLVSESGILNYSKTDLNKAFAGKDVTVTPFLSATSEGFNLKSNPESLETLFQLVNLYFTQAKIDSAASATFIKRTKSTLSTIKLNPQKYFEDQIAHTLSQDNLRGGGVPTETDLDKVDYKRAAEIFRKRFDNAGDFGFVFVGSFDIEKIKPLILTYIGSLPSVATKEKAKDLGIRPPKGYVEKKVYKGLDQKSNVKLVYTGSTKYDDKDAYILQSLNDVLTIKLMESLREKQSGVYGVSANGRLAKYPYENYVEQISFQCAPGNVDTLINAALVEVDKIKKDGVAPVVLNKVKETQRRKLEMNAESNSFWLGELADIIVYNLKPEDIQLQMKQIESLNSDQIKKTTKKVFGKNCVRFVLYPEK